jgi:broad specificity phosphatase PhoE
VFATREGLGYSLVLGLDEVDHGKWEGEFISDLEPNKRSGFHKWMQNPAKEPIPGSSESATEAQNRVLREVVDIAMSNRHEVVLIVAHKHLLALLMCGLLCEPLDEFAYAIDEDIVPRLLPGRAVAEACRRLRDHPGSK